MVLKRQIKLKRVKDLEPGDLIRIESIVIKVAGQKNGKWIMKVVDRDGEIDYTYPHDYSVKSMQWVELIENSKEI